MANEQNSIDDGRTATAIFVSVFIEFFGDDGSDEDAQRRIPHDSLEEFRKWCFHEWNLVNGEQKYRAAFDVMSHLRWNDSARVVGMSLLTIIRNGTRNDCF